MTPVDRAELVRMIARTMFIRYYVEDEDASIEWATGYWDECVSLEHKGDCPIAEIQGPITCDRCVCDEWVSRAGEVLAVIEAAGVRLVPAEATKQQTDVAFSCEFNETELAASSIYRAMVAASPYGEKKE